MELSVRTGGARERRAGMTAVLCFEDDAPGAALADRAHRATVARLRRMGDFRGRALESALVYAARDDSAGRTLFVGLGRRGDLTRPRLLQAAAIAARRARAMRARTLGIRIPDALAAPQWIEAAAEGVVLGHHRFAAYRSDPSPAPLVRAELVVARADAGRELARAAAVGARWAEGTCLARDLASTPGQDLTPERLAARAKDAAEAAGAAARVLSRAQLERLGMGLLLAVGRGSPNPPCLVVLDRPAAAAKAASAKSAKSTSSKSANAAPTIVLIGKGITYDTGGLPPKGREDLVRMKYDMSGAAAVIGAFSALPTIDPPFRIVGLLPCAENVVDGRSYKPGDVLRAMDGTTVEVTNTDAEGRLVLADALCYARTLGPAIVVDVATLTGAVRIALGRHAAGLFSTDEPLAASLLAAGSATGERLWRMPLWEEHGNELSSDVADVVNFASREGGASLAAAFLARFARGLRWAHVDFASTGWCFAERPHESRGPTGFGARLLLEWLRASAAPSAAAAGARSIAPRTARSSAAASSGRARRAGRRSAS